MRIFEDIGKTSISQNYPQKPSLQQWGPQWQRPHILYCQGPFWPSRYGHTSQFRHTVQIVQTSQLLLWSVKDKNYFIKNPLLFLNACIVLNKSILNLCWTLNFKYMQFHIMVSTHGKINQIVCNHEILIPCHSWLLLAQKQNKLKF